MPYYRSAANYVETVRVGVWAFNSSLNERVVRIAIDAFDIESGAIVFTETVDRAILAATQSTELLDFTVDPKIAWSTVLAVRLFAEDNNVISRHASWPEPLKYVKFPSTAPMGINVQSEDPHRLMISSKTPVK